MDAGFFDVLHYPADDDALTVTDRIDIKLSGIAEKFIYQYRMLTRSDNCVFHAGFQGRFIVNNFHRPAAQNK